MSVLLVFCHSYFFIIILFSHVNIHGHVLCLKRCLGTLDHFYLGFVQAGIREPQRESLLFSLLFGRLIHVSFICHLLVITAKDVLQSKLLQISLIEVVEHAWNRAELWRCGIFLRH